MGWMDAKFIYSKAAPSSRTVRKVEERQTVCTFLLRCVETSDRMGMASTVEMNAVGVG